MVVLVLAAAAVAAAIVLMRAWRRRDRRPRRGSVVVPRVWTAASAAMWANVVIAGHGLSQVKSHLPVSPWVGIPVAVLATTSILLLNIWIASGLSAGDREVLSAALFFQIVVVADSLLALWLSPSVVDLVVIAVVLSGLALIVASVRTPVRRATALVPLA